MSKRDEVLEKIPDAELREVMKRLSVELGIGEDDTRWGFLEMVINLPADEREAIFETIGKASYGMDDAEVEAWKARLDTQTGPIVAAIKADIQFEKQQQQTQVQSHVVEMATYMQKTGRSARDVALDGLSQPDRERVIVEAASVGIVAEYDVGWFLIGSQLRCWAAAAAAGASTEELYRLLESLPQRMLDGARLASADVGGEIKAAVTEVRGAILGTGKLVAGSMKLDLDHVKKAINDSAVIGADKIKTASESLIGKLDAAVDQKKNEGAREWAMIAEKAAVDSAKTALGKVAVRGGLFAVLLLLIGVVVGVGGLWAARTISGDYLPAGVQTFQSPAGSDFIRVAQGRATVGQAIACGPDLCIPLVPVK